MTTTTLTVALPAGLYVAVDADGPGIWRDDPAHPSMPVAVAHSWQVDPALFTPLAAAMVAAGMTGTCTCGHDRTEHRDDSGCLTWLVPDDPDDTTSCDCAVFVGAPIGLTAKG